MSSRAKNILYGVVVTVLAGFLIFMFIQDRIQSGEIDEKNRLIAMQQEEEDRQRRAAGEEIYNQLLQALEACPVEFVCWGDSQAVGNRMGTITKSLEDKIEDVYFSDVKNAFLTEARLYSVKEIGIPVINMGAQEEGIHEIMARTGVHQMVIGEDFVMPSRPSDFERKNITLADENGNTLLFADQPYALFGETVIDGVKGRLYTGDGYYDKAHSKLAFGRDAGGQSYTVPAGTAVDTDGANKYRSCYPILYFSEYADIPVEVFLEYMQEIILAYGDHEHCAVICVTTEGSAWDLALCQVFGNQYIRQDKSVEAMTVNDYDTLAEKALNAFISQGVFEQISSAVEIASQQIQQMAIGK